MTAKYPTGKVLTYYALFGGGIGGLIHLIGVMLFPMNETISREKLRQKLWFEMDKGVAFSLPYKTAETWTFTVPQCD